MRLRGYNPVIAQSQQARAARLRAERQRKAEERARADADRARKEADNIVREKMRNGQFSGLTADEILRNIQDI
jgi:regulator of protease activity HflC (stomatin/prohibitin superfamily)